MTIAPKDIFGAEIFITNTKHKTMKTRTENIEEQISSDVIQLKSLTKSEDDLTVLNRLEKHARDGYSLKHWFNRFLFGFGLADAIENWVQAFGLKLGKPVKNKLLEEETKEVAVAWMRFSLMRMLIYFVLTSALTVLTAIFLYKQVGNQEELMAQQDKHYKLNSKFEYTKFLFDEICRESTKIQIIVRSPNDPNCKPVHNSRQRGDAAKALFEITKDLSFSYLNATNLNNTNFEGSNLHRANLNGASLIEANLNGANLNGAQLNKTDLIGALLIGTHLYRANLNNTVLIKANLSDALLGEADLSKANLVEANLSGANLSGANLSSADLSGAKLLRAKYDKNTKFPESFSPVEAGMILRE